jgi:ribosomal protein S18 acetylase RimI-like enzyme
MTAEMVPEVAKVHSHAFAGYMNTRVGTAYVKAFLSWFLRAERAIALVATDNSSKIIGYIVGAPLGYNGPMNRDLFWVAARGIIMRPWLFFNTQFVSTIIARIGFILGRSPVRHEEPALPWPTMSLVGIGVSPLAQGKRVGVFLMQAFEVRARELQMRSLRLSVYSDNMVARRLYEKCGWHPYPKPIRGEEAMYYIRILDEQLSQNEGL